MEMKTGIVEDGDLAVEEAVVAQGVVGALPA
jgi:hypothetical protein